eukprot:COSAG02_NODE_28510_length_588_cov_0.832311_1_plen_62_part_01
MRACTSVGTVKRDGGHRLALPAAAGNDHTDSAATTPTSLAGAAPAALGTVLMVRQPQRYTHN